MINAYIEPHHRNPSEGADCQASQLGQQGGSELEGENCAQQGVSHVLICTHSVQHPEGSHCQPSTTWQKGCHEAHLIKEDKGVLGDRSQDPPDALDVAGEG